MDRAELEGAVQALLAERGRVLLALEGMSAAGKTTLAAELAQAYGGNVYHMDDFCFPAHQRPDDWRQAPGGHMDLERFRREVLKPLSRKEAVAYRPYSCRKGEFGAERLIWPAPLEIVEGAYATHPRLAAAYDLSVFVQVDPEEQRRRILARNGQEGLLRFEEIWIPQEMRYFRACGTAQGCHARLSL